MHSAFGNLTYNSDDQAWFGTASLALFARFGEAADEDEEPRRREGLLSLSISDETRAGPLPAQVAAFQHLREHEAEVFDAVLRSLFACYQEYAASPIGGFWDRVGSWFGVKPVTSPAELAAHAHFTSLEVSGEQKADFAYLLFHVHCDWEPEHGMLVVYHKDQPTTWSTPDALEIGVDQ